MAKKNFYAVKGNNITPVIYTTWKECESFVKGRKGVLYKGFITKQEAEDFLSDAPESIEHGIFAWVDGSYTPKYSHGGWGIVIEESETEIHREFGSTPGPALSRNIDGEVIAAMKAIEWSIDHNQPITICHDYAGIAHWAKGEWQAKSEIAKQYQDFCNNKLEQVTFKKVAAHSGIKWNDIADELAKQGCK